MTLNSQGRPARALSSSHLDEYERETLLFRTKAPDKPVHRAVESLFSTSSGFNNFRGLVNLGSFLLLVTTCRMALENVLKYGIVMDPFYWISFVFNSQEKWASIGLIVCCNVFIITGWLLERAVVQQRIGNTVLVVLILWNLFCVLAFPTGLILSCELSPFFSAPILSMYTIVFLKLWSYAMVNHWCRVSARQQKKANRHHTPCATNKGSNKARDSEHPNQQQSTQEDGKRSQSSNTTNEPALNTSGNPVSGMCVRCRKLSLKDTVTKSGQSISATSPERRSAASQTSKDRMMAGSARYSTTTVPDALVQLSDDSSGCDENNPSEWQRRLNPVSNLTDTVAVHYPNNLTLGDIYYFMFAPTLCYELNFPRTLYIRKHFVIKRLFELLFLPQLVFCLSQQWVVPILRNSVAPFAELNFAQIIERCLKLAIPNHLLWLILFYAMFHSQFNFLAELMRFGDRYFYSDWWNAESVPIFWTKWNIPVHRWARRHLYIPLLQLGYSRFAAGMVVFFVSAFFHELLVSVPLKMMRLWSFLAMIIQMPYARAVSYLFPHGGPWGNLAVWIALIIGQPLAILFYFHDYYVLHFT